MHLRAKRHRAFLKNKKLLLVVCLLVLCSQSFFQYQIDFPVNTMSLGFPSLLELHKLGLKCLRESNSPYGYHYIPLLSQEERQEERERMWNMTEQFRHYPQHKWRGFSGPWIEDLWISEFWNKDISEFGPYVPLFVQWVNVAVFHRRLNVSYPEIMRPIFKSLKPDFMYITVSFNDWGLEGMPYPNPDIPPNILVISASGRGHIPILLHYRPQEWVDMLPITNKIVFAGNLKRPERAVLVNKCKSVFRENMTVSWRTDNWKTMFRSHELVFSPRGNARGTFRTTECLQMGLIPVIAFRSRKWLPFNSTLPWNDMAFVVALSEIEDFKKTADSLTPERLAFMRQTIRKYKYSHFTIEATIRHIQLFLKYGYAKSDLRCGEYYANR